MKPNAVLTKKGKKEIYDLLESARYDDSKIPPKDTVILTIDDKPVGTQNSFVCISGLPKNGKSTFLQLMIASIHTAGDLHSLNITPPAGRPDLVWFDTEHSESEFHSIVQQVKRLMQINNWPDNFQAYLCSDLSPEQIPLMIETVLGDNPNIFAIFLDTLLDLSNNFNDVGEAMQIGRWIKRIKKQYQVMILGVIHLGKKDLNTLGHLGSMVDRWARGVMTVEKNKSGGFTLSCKYQRGSAEYDPVTVSYTADGTIIRSYTQDDDQAKRPDFNPWKSQDGAHRFMIDKVIPAQGVIYKTIYVDLAELKSMSQGVAKKFIAHWISQGMVYKKGDLYLADRNHKIFKTPLLISIK